MNAIEDGDEESEFDSWIYPTTGSGLSNWTAKDFVPISKDPKNFLSKHKNPFLVVFVFIKKMLKIILNKNLIKKIIIK